MSDTPLPEGVDGVFMPTVQIAYRCGTQLLEIESGRCGLVVAPKGPEGTQAMHLSCAGSDGDVLLMAVAVVHYVRSLGLGDALAAAVKEIPERGMIDVVRAALFEHPPEE